MEISDHGVQFICAFEGFRSRPYQDTGGIWTVGYGTVITKEMAAQLSLNGISEATAETWLKNHIEQNTSSLNNILKHSIFQHQFDALTSLVYNIGMEGFHHSELYRRITNQDPSLYSYWINLAIHDSKGHQLIGLIRRRRCEARLFIYGNYSTT
jgi:lysozyme